MDLSEDIANLSAALEDYVAHFNGATHTDNSQSNSRASSLTVKSIRRYMDETVVPLDKDLTLIYAPNGVGKSSLVDALELLVHEETMRRRHSSFSKNETREETALPSWNHSPDQMGIRLKFEDNTSLSYGSLVSESETLPKSDPVNAFRTISRYSVRHSLQGSKTDRFKQIFSILQLEGLQKRTEELTSEYTRLMAAVKDAVELKDRILQVLPNGMQLVALDPLMIENRKGRPAQDQLNNLIKAQQVNASDLASLDDLIDSITSLDLTFSAKKPAKPQTEFPSFRDGELNAIETLLKTVEQGENCPFCASSKITEEILDSITKLLDRNKEWVAFDTASHSFDHKKELWSLQAQKLAEYIAEVRRLNLSLENKRRFTALEMKSFEFKDPPTDSQTLSEIQDELIHITNTHQISIKNAGKMLIEQVDALKPENADAIQQAIGLLGAKLEDRKKNLSLAKAALHLQTQMLAWKKSFDATQKRIATDALEPIRNDILGWWDLLAPARTGFQIQININPSGASPSINIDCIPSHTTASTQKSIKAYSKPATGHLSDSQLDLLALSIVFASHQRQFGNGLLWMDDPSDMFDDDTRKNFFAKAVPKLIKQGIQVVIATHSRGIVEECWKAIGSAHKSTASDTKDFGRSFRQVNLDIQNVENDANLNLSKVVISPFDSVSAREQLNAVLKEIRHEQNQWIIGLRLRFSSSLRRYTEFQLAELSYALNYLLIGDKPSKIKLIGDSTATLNEYYRDCKNTLEKLYKIAERLNSEKPALQHIITIFDSMLDALNTLNTKALNEGSHAAATIPSYTELNTVLENLDKLMIPAKIDHSGDFPKLEKLKSVYPEAAYRECWETAVQAVENEITALN